MGLAETLRKDADSLWRKNLTHPFVQGIGDGSLPVERFKYFLQQDYAFLIDYSRALAIAAAKAPDLEGMTKFSALLHATLSQEMNIHRTYCAGFGITAKSLEAQSQRHPPIRYTGHLIDVANKGSIQEIAAALLPCQWGYSDVGLHLKKTGDLSEKNRYREWIENYASPEFKESADWLRGYLNRQTKGISKPQHQRLQKIFSTSAQHEYNFWDMAWNI